MRLVSSPEIKKKKNEIERVRMREWGGGGEGRCMAARIAGDRVTDEGDYRAVGFLHSGQS